MMMNDSRKNLGKLLQQKRKSVRLTLNRLSAASGVSPSHLGRIENGERFPSADILQRIARPLGFSEEEIFTLAGYISTRQPVEEKVPASKIDPYVERILAQEPVEIQRAALGILTILKSLSTGTNATGSRLSQNSQTIEKSGISIKV
jgi:transcriptional regulator with XRE-family HTH domain